MIVYKRGLGYHQAVRQNRIIGGHGYKIRNCQHGSGIFDIITDVSKPVLDFVSNNKDLAKHIGETAINATKVGHNTKQIIDAIKNDYKPKNLTTNEQVAYDHKHLKDIINRINNLRVSGSGFCYT